MDAPKGWRFMYSVPAEMLGKTKFEDLVQGFKDLEETHVGEEFVIVPVPMLAGLPIGLPFGRDDDEMYEDGEITRGDYRRLEGLDGLDGAPEGGD